MELLRDAFEGWIFPNISYNIINNVIYFILFGVFTVKVKKKPRWKLWLPGQSNYINILTSPWVPWLKLSRLTKGQRTFKVLIYCTGEARMHEEKFPVLTCFYNYCPLAFRNLPNIWWMDGCINWILVPTFRTHMGTFAHDLPFTWSYFQQCTHCHYNCTLVAECPFLSFHLL